MRTFAAYGKLIMALAIAWAVLLPSCTMEEQFCVSCEYGMPCVISYDSIGNPIDTFCQVSYETDSQFAYRFAQHIEGSGWMPQDTQSLDSGYYIRCFEGPDMAAIDSVNKDSMGWSCRMFRNLE